MLALIMPFVNTYAFYSLKWKINMKYGQKNISKLFINAFVSKFHIK